MIQRFASAFNTNVSFHMLFLDAVCMPTGDRLTVRRAPPWNVAMLEKLVRVISEQLGRALERQGLLERDVRDSFLTFESKDKHASLEA